jgi:uncharacterized protein DUF3485
MLSSRYAPAVCLALLVVLVPTIIHSYAGIVVKDGRSTASIPGTLSSYTSLPTKRGADWGKDHFESDDWFERQYTSADDSVVLTVVRSYDLKALYHHPELAVAYRFANFDRHTTETPADRPEIPVHVLTSDESRAVGLYVLQYDGRFIADPIRFQLRTAVELLFSGRKPMTLFFVRDDAAASGVSPLKLPAATLLFEAVDRFSAPPAAQ